MLSPGTFYEEKLKAFMKEKGIDGEHLTFSRSCHSVAEAAAAAGVTPEDFVKSICMVDGEGRLIVGIVKGEDRASTSRGGESPEGERGPDGYARGSLWKDGIPLWRHAFLWLSLRVFESIRRSWRWSLFTWEGGSESSLVKIKPSEIIKGNGGEVLRIREVECNRDFTVGMRLVAQG